MRRPALTALALIAPALMVTALMVTALMVTGCVQDADDGPSGAGGEAGGGGAGGGPDAGDPPDAVKHRPTGASCDDRRAVPEPNTEFSEGACATHADCADGANGRCIENRGGRYCSYDACFVDADCADDQACHCGADWDGNRCVPSDCRTDADCPAGACSPTLGSCGDYSGVEGYYCHTPEDDCVNDADCGPLGGQFYCAYNPAAARWQCSDSQCVG